VISQSKKLEEISLLQPALTCNNELWYERIGTARQFALVLPNVVHNMEHTLVTLAGQTATWTIVTVARVRRTQNRKSSLAVGRSRETRRSLLQLVEQPWPLVGRSSGIVDKRQETVVQCPAMPSKQPP
jgi:hypothetical protein